MHQKNASLNLNSLFACYEVTRECLDIFCFTLYARNFECTNLTQTRPNHGSDRKAININKSEPESRADWTARLIRVQDGTSEQLERKRKLPVGSLGYLFYERSYCLITFLSDRLFLWKVYCPAKHSSVGKFFFFECLSVYHKMFTILINFV